MSTNYKERTPLIMYGRYLDGASLLTVWGFLVMFGLVILWLNDSMQMPTPYVWPIIPAVMFTVGAVVMGIVQTGKEHINKEKSAENISSYLRENYGIIAGAADCAVYCDSPPTESEDKIINVTNSSGEKVKITLKFSDDLTSVTPFLYDVTITKLVTTKGH